MNNQTRAYNHNDIDIFAGRRNVSAPFFITVKVTKTKHVAVLTDAETISSKSFNAQKYIATRRPILAIAQDTRTHQRAVLRAQYLNKTVNCFFPST